ncbi:MAG: tetratricopeptide repeat protein [Oligoflexus sp.]
MKHVLKMAAVVGMMSLQIGCVTGFGGSHVNPYDRAQIVHQTTGRDVLSHMGRDYWVQVRKTADSDQMRLYASLGTKDWDVAINDARAYLKDHPKDRVALTVLATALAMKQNYSLAAYYGNLIEQYYPGYPETANLLGLAVLNRPGASYRDFQEAASHFEKAFDAHGNQVASGLNLGHLHLEMANAEAAKSVFRIVRSRCGDCSEAMIGYGIASSLLQEYDEAEQTFAAILSREALHVEAQYYLALISAYGKQDDQRAIKLLANLLGNPSNENLEIKRKANFLLRRLEARKYAPRPDESDREFSETIIRALDQE